MVDHRWMDTLCNLIVIMHGVEYALCTKEFKAVGSNKRIWSGSVLFEYANTISPVSTSSFVRIKFCVSESTVAITNASVQTEVLYSNHE